MRRALAVLSVLVLAATSAVAQTSGGPDMQDRNFIRDAALMNLSELQMAKLAREKAEQPAVRAFADRLAVDHRRAVDRLQGIATSLDLKLPEEMDATGRSRTNDLAGLSGMHFDRRFLAYQEEAHLSAIKLFEAQAASGTDEALKGFAREQVPHLHAHHGEVQALMTSTEQAQGQSTQGQPGATSGSSQ